MGIQNLLQTLKSISTRQHLEKYRNKRAAIDGYCWLHKSIYSLGKDILSPNPDYSHCMNYLKRRLYSLQKYGIIPVIVFDGAKLPMKAGAEDTREKNRKKLNEEAEVSLKNNDISGAIKKKSEAFDINPQMAFEFIQILKQNKIEYFVAPYEADLQLAYLSKINYVDLVITEDSDLIALGCKCVLYKLDKVQQNVGEEIKYDNIKLCKEYDFSMFNEDKFLCFCILCGCDYFKMKNVGAKYAYYAVRDNNGYRNSLIWLSNKIRGWTISLREMEENFEKAFITFRYQVIYCPIEKKMKYFGDITKEEYPFFYKYKNDLSFLGEIKEGSMVNDIVFGYIDPITKKRFEEKNILVCVKENENQEENNSIIYKKSKSIDICHNNKKNLGRSKPKKVKSKSRLQTSIDNFFVQKKEDTSCNENIDNSNNNSFIDKNSNVPIINRKNKSELIPKIQNNLDIDEIKSTLVIEKSLTSKHSNDTELTTQITGDNNYICSKNEEKNLSNLANKVIFSKRKYEEAFDEPKRNQYQAYHITAKYNNDNQKNKKESNFDTLLIKYNYSDSMNESNNNNEINESFPEELSSSKKCSSEKPPQTSQSFVDLSDYCFNPLEEIKNY